MSSAHILFARVKWLRDAGPFWWTSSKRTKRTKRTYERHLGKGLKQIACRCAELQQRHSSFDQVTLWVLVAVWKYLYPSCMSFQALVVDGFATIWTMWSRLIKLYFCAGLRNGKLDWNCWATELQGECLGCCKHCADEFQLSLMEHDTTLFWEDMWSEL